jgi:hypothetical protein
VTRPPRPSLGPERLAELLDDAVQHVTASGDALDRIRRGVRRRRTARRAGAVLLAVAVLAGGGSTALAVTSGRGPSGLASGAASSSSAGAQRPTTGVTLVSAPASSALPPGAALAPAPSAVPSAASSGDSQAKAASSGDSQAKAAYPSSLGQRSLGQSSSWDMDGDGRPDTAMIVPVGNTRTTSSFRLVVHLTRLGTQSVPFTATSMTGMPPYGPVIAGEADAAHDGHAQLFVLVDAGCCTEFWTIFRLVDGRVRQVTMSGRPVRLAVGGTVMNNGGFSCAGPGLVTYAYQPGITAGSFLATRDTYRWAGATLVLASYQQTTIHGTASDPALTRYTGVSCGALPQYVSAR